MRAVWLIAVKDLRASVRSRAVLIIGFVAPLSLALTLDLVFGDLNEGVITFEVGLAVEDAGPLGGAFTDVVGETAEAGLLDVIEYDGEREARAAVDAGDVDVSFVVPSGFSTATQSGQAAEILVVASVDEPTAGTVARSIATGFTSSIGTGQLAAIVALDTGVASVADVEAIASEVAASGPLAGLREIDAGEEPLNPATILTAGMAVFFTLFTAGLPIVGVLRERTQGTLARLLAAPIPSAAITAGKTLAAVITGVVSMVALMVASTVIMGADWGPPFGAVLLSVAVVLAAAGIMSMAGAAAKTAEQAGNAQSVVAVTIAFLGGTFIQGPRMEEGVLGALGLLTPNRWFLRGLEASSGGGAIDALPAVGVLLSMAVVTGAVGLRLARTALRR